MFGKENAVITIHTDVGREIGKLQSKLKECDNGNRELVSSEFQETMERITELIRELKELANEIKDLHTLNKNYTLL